MRWVFRNWFGNNSICNSMLQHVYKRRKSLVLYFVKFVIEKYANWCFAPITIPPGASFKDMLALKVEASIGRDVNKKILAPLFNETKLYDKPDFDDYSDFALQNPPKRSHLIRDWICLSPVKQVSQLFLR